MTSSQGELRLSKLGGHELVPGGKSTFRWQGRARGRAASEGGTGGRRNPTSAGAFQARVTQDEMGTRDTAGSTSRHHFPPTAIHLAAGTGAAPAGPPHRARVEPRGQESGTEGAVRGATRSGAPPGGGGGLRSWAPEISAARRLPWAQPEDAPLPRGTAAHRPCGEGAASR